MHTELYKSSGREFLMQVSPNFRVATHLSDRVMQIDLVSDHRCILEYLHTQHKTNCLAPSSRVVSACDCGVRATRFESHCRRLCLSRQPLKYTALGMGCTLTLQCLGRLSLPLFAERKNEYQLMDRVIITMARVDVDGSCQFSADSQPKLIGLV